MVTFYTGSEAAKRKLFRSFNGIKGVASLDNDEILATFSVNKKHYSVIGDIPFSNLTLEQYIACQRSLVTKMPMSREAIKIMLRGAGLLCSPRRRMRKLSRIEYRAASLVTKLSPETKTLYVNFDALEYSRKNMKEMKRFLAVWAKHYEVFVAVSDSRFILPKCKTLSYTEEGVSEKEIKNKARAVRKSKFKKRLTVSGMNIHMPFVKTVVECSV